MCEVVQTSPQQPTGCAVWLYARSGGKDTAVLDQQMQNLLEYAKQQGYFVAGTSQDLDNGKGVRRKGLKQMLRTVRRGRVRGVLVQDVDRLSYDSATLLRIMQFLQRYNVILSTTESDLQYELTLRGLEEKLRKQTKRKGVCFLG